ncbi:MAG: hypothetical protein JNL82_14990 [Myxococcales bacterium]|nr:hypothetical protein [Myxococcales bacterium]
MMLRRLALALALGLATPQTARAWDPSTTHLGMIDRAVQASALHLRWMAASELQRGLFTPLRVDPARLKPSERRFLSEALGRSHSGAGVQPLGGPGACPGPKAPPTTQLYCVQGDVWEMPAVQWIHLGAVAELVPSARAVHHFVDRRDPAALAFDDPQQRPLLLRARQYRSNGSSLAGYVTGTSFAGTGPSAIAWLADAADPLAPPATFRHLELASTLADPRARDHHLAMALVGVGALLHVLQDMSVPAHARGDVTAFFSALSDAAGDRGLPFNELARLSFRRHDLPSAAGLGARGSALTPGLREHFLGHAAAGDDPGYEGLAVFTGRRFLSERTVPPAQHLDHGLGPAEAAARLLAGADLDPGELEGAQLSPWPGVRGYLKTSTGRPLAAFDTDAEGRIRCYIDEAVYREQFAQLIPRAIDATRSLIDWVWPAWPELHYDAAAGRLDLAAAADLQNPEVLVFTQDPEGVRTIRQKVRLTPGVRGRVAGLPQASADLRVVVVLRATRKTGEPLVLEHVLGAESKVFPVVPAPAPPAPPELPLTPAEPTDPAAEPPSEPAPDAPPAEPADAAAPIEPDPKTSPSAPAKPTRKTRPPQANPDAAGSPGATASKPAEKPAAKPASAASKPTGPAEKPAAPAPKTSSSKPSEPAKPGATKPTDSKSAKPPGAARP